jgi:peroxiredoxin family protein/TusA-related sulfurtransferase
MKCPAPILSIAVAAREFGSRPGILEVVASDEDFPRDVRAWCRTTKAALIHLDEAGREKRAVIGINGVNLDPDAVSSSARVEPVPRSAVVERSARPVHPVDDDGPAVHVRGFERVDTRGSSDPLALLAQAVARLEGEQGLFEVLSNQANFPSELQRWCRSRGAELHDLAINGDAYRAVLSVGWRPNEDGQPRHDTLPPAPPVGLPPPPPSARSRTESRSTQALAVREPALRELDLRGLRAPEPLLRLAAQITENPGVRFSAIADDPAFVTDTVAWAGAMKVVVRAVHQADGVARLELSMPERAAAPVAYAADATPQRAALQLALAAPTPEAAPRENRFTILIIHNDFEALMAALICATSAAAQGMQTSVFFSFWGVNVLRGEHPRRDVAREPKNPLQSLMQAMMPRGPRRQKMGKMHMGGMGKGMMQFFMKRNSVMTLEQLIDHAATSGVRFIVCSMSMGIMGIQKRDIMDLPNIEFAGVASFVDLSQRSSSTLVF